MHVHFADRSAAIGKHLIELGAPGADLPLPHVLESFLAVPVDPVSNEGKNYIHAVGKGRVAVHRLDVDDHTAVDRKV